MQWFIFAFWEIEVRSDWWYLNFLLLTIGYECFVIWHTT